MKRLSSLLITTLFVTATASALEPVNKSRGLALKGYDAVAYFAAGKPMKGSSDFQTTWNGATWRFASEKSLAAFLAEPSKYAPQFGGYCAWAVSRNYTADADPTAWRIVDGKLYVNYNADVQKEWQKDVAGNITRGNRNWPGLLKK